MNSVFWAKITITYLISLFTGLKNQMLEPTQQMTDGTNRLYIPGYINIQDDLRCTTTASMKRFQNFNDYDDYEKSAINFLGSKVEKDSTGILFWKSTVSLLPSTVVCKKVHKIGMYGVKLPWEIRHVTPMMMPHPCPSGSRLLFLDLKFLFIMEKDRPTSPTAIVHHTDQYCVLFCTQL